MAARGPRLANGMKEVPDHSMVQEEDEVANLEVNDEEEVSFWLCYRGQWCYTDHCGQHGLENLAGTLWIRPGSKGGDNVREKNLSRWD